MARPLVSVIMNCLNAERYLREAIDSVYAQTYPHWEIILWDNASTDGSAAVAKSYDGRLRYFRGEATVPLGAARNLALTRATGDLIAFLDCDDTWLPDKLVRQVPLFEGRPEVDFVYSNFYHFDQQQGSRKPALAGTQPQGRVFEPFLRRYRVGLLTAMLRRSALVRLNAPFDESFNLIEEFDLFMRLLYRGQAAYVATPLAVCRIHGANISTLQRERWTEEHRRALEKLRKLDADGLYVRQLDDMAVRIELMAAMIDLARGRQRSARALVAPHKWTGLKAFGIFLVSFIPARLWLALLPLWRRGLLYR